MRGKWYGRERLTLKAMLLAAPALFWAVVFMEVAGLWPLPSALAAVPEWLQLSLILACPLGAILLGLTTAQDEKHVRGSKGAGPLAGAALLALGLLVSLGAA